MSGVQSFVGRMGGRHTGPIADQPIREDRAGASNYKIQLIDTTKRFSASSKKSTTSTSVSGAQYPAQSFRTAPSSRERLDDSSVDENFDITASSLHFGQQLDAIEPVIGNQDGFSDDVSGEDELESVEVESTGHQEPYHSADYDVGIPNYRNEEYESEPVQPAPLHTLRRKGGSPITQRQQQASKQSAQSSAISGRFSKSLSFPIRSGQQELIQNEPLQQKKRPRTPEPPNSDRYENGLHPHRPDPALNASSDDTGRGRGLETIRKTASPDRTPRRIREVRSSEPTPVDQDITTEAHPKKTSRISADFSDEKLKNMTYAEVEAPTWEWGNELSNDDRPLVERLQDIVGRTEPGEVNLDTIDFFAKLPTAEWEESGEWFVERFAELMQKMSEKRRERRAVTAKYETELKEREKAVRGKSENLDKMLKEMRASGEDMLRGKF